MYSTLPHFILGFHGCDQSVADEIISSSKKHLKTSDNEYDWLGSGIYFWENNPVRALEYAKSLQRYPERSNKKITKPAVIGAIIDLGYCLNLLETKSIETVAQAYKSLTELYKITGQPMPQNKDVKGSKDLLLRHLDCAVIDLVHLAKSDAKEREYDSVRGMFTEGKPLYENAGFHAENHIQICVRNINCIKGYFHPREASKGFLIP